LHPEYRLLTLRPRERAQGLEWAAIPREPAFQTGSRRIGESNLNRRSRAQYWLRRFLSARSDRGLCDVIAHTIDPRKATIERSKWEADDTES
jgi:hypothetical protein